MFRTKVTFAFLMGCLCSMGGPAQDDREPLKVEPAYLLGAETVYFSPLIPMDWEEIARKNFKQFDLDHPDRKEIQRHYVSITGESPFFYGAPLPQGTKSGFYYIFYSGGVVSITLTQLAGTIVYRVTPAFSGTVVARAPGPGFVVMSDTPRTVEKTRDLPLVNGPDVPGISAQTRPGNIDYVYTDQQGRRTVLSGLCHNVRMAPIKTYLTTFAADPIRYVFIVWGDKGMKPQEGSNFNLIAIDPEGRVKWIRSNPCEQLPSL